MIVVGMRFQDQVLIEDVIHLFKTGKNPQLLLKREINKEATNGVAVAVWYLHKAMGGHSEHKVGYIREKDKQDCLRNFSSRTFEILSVSTNWWNIKEGIGGAHVPITNYDGSDTTYSQECKAKLLNDSATPQPTTAPEVKEGYIPLPKNFTFNKEYTKMNNMRDSFFREVKNVAIDIQSGKFGVMSNEGISVYAEGGISVNPIAELGVKIPAFALRVAVKDLKEGDIVINGNESSFFKGLTENGYEVVNLSGEVKQVGSVTNMFFGKNSVLAVKNMFGEGTNPMMMALLMGDGGFGEGDNKKLMLAMAMSGGFGSDMNPLMMMLMLGK